MRLLPELEAHFVQYEVRIGTWQRIRAEVFAARPAGPYADADLEEVTGPQVYHARVDTLAEAHGVQFLCPKCYAANGGPIGTHSVLCWFADKVPDEAEPGPGRWTPSPSSTDLSNLTFVSTAKRSHSVLLLGGGCGWHGFVTNGDAA